MKKIIILEKSTAERIAAGEVIERPASVVKELIENSIDAGSSKITIEIVSGGQNLIQITDTGCGMSKPDTISSLKRFATSKIKQIEDLEHLKTLGFRGEALPSIAAISKMEIHTKEKESNTGTYLEIEAGKINKTKEISFSEGTKILVTDLFYNTPARKKFLKSIASETAQIIDLVSKFSLFYQNIHFILINNKKEILNWPSQMDRLSKIAKIFNLEKDDLISFKTSQSWINLEGVIAKPNLNRGNRKSQIFFVNGRFIKNILLSQALREGYSRLLEPGRFPYAVLFVEIDPRFIDVNVHPSKTEIRLANPKQVFRIVNQQIQYSLKEADFSFEPRKFFEAYPTGFDFKYRPRTEAATETAVLDLPDLKEAPFEYKITPEFDEIKILTQLHNTYIVAVVKDSLWIVDQHAAQERLNYELIKSKTTESNITSQKLLLPINLELTPKQKVFLEENLSLFRNLGFTLEPFGREAFLIQEIPFYINPSEAKRTITDILDELTLKTIPSDKKKEKILETVACKSSIQAGQKLTPEEMYALIRQLVSKPDLKTCPHGRPIFFKFDLKQLNKIFKRPQASDSRH